MSFFVYFLPAIVLDEVHKGKNGEKEEWGKAKVQISIIG